MREQIQAQIERLRNIASSFQQVYGWGADTARFTNIAAQLEFAIRPQWVPVYDRLPDEFYDVFAWDGDRLRLAYRCDGRWVRNDGFILRDVTHWHEIDYPQPPEVQ